MVSLRKILVVGATGATGKHVVQMLLDRGDTTVVALVRSKEKMMDLLNLDDDNNDEKNESKNKKIDNLILEEAAIAELGNEKLQDLTKGCQAVIRYAAMCIQI
jgi:nucleoside-diphosphate-sugar epimerase